ncbi:serine/threonine-protein kinase [Candidatus Uabimicrobium amorphum]|uniref:non-specific serine/threonine protein kinase n=1 Tax=Uabimicrobium amorphum TaxID=2596890 RepID=A0A5S9IUX0_UABAM|nr:serine/threonine-protein kinase [Candidatus Uabimicrobium amorphum]BBM87970.1 serine/threonine protein kinase [Candidatus Uabimicrobium amorphum]
MNHQNSNTANFGKYIIEKELGRGGMGVVYKAYDTQYDIYVALKLITKEGFSQDDYERFSQEIKALARLNHPNIVRFYEFSTTPKPYFTMEYIEGCTLDKKIKEHNVKSLWLVEVMMQICKALEHAHQCNIIHRDIKPSNILIDTQGVVKVMDFGVAKIDSAHRQNLSQSGTIIGSIHYMAPEQVLGKATYASDIYSVGATMYEALTYRTMYQGDNQMNIFYKIIRNDFIPLRQIRPQISPYLEAICIKCLQKRRKKRYQSFTELHTELKNFKSNRPITAKKYTKWDAFYKFFNRHRFALTSVVIIFLTLVISLFVTLGALKKADQTAQKLQVALEEADQSSEKLQKLNEAMLQSLTYISRQNRHVDLFRDAQFLKPVRDVFAQSLELQTADQYRILRGYVLLESHHEKDLLQAVKDYTAILQKVKNHFMYTNRGKAYERLGKRKKAIADYNRAIALDANHYFAFFNRGVLFQKAKPHRAISDYTQVIKLHPSYYKAYYNRGQVYYDLAKYQEALADFSKVLSIVPEYVHAYFWKGLTYRKLNKADVGLQNFSHAIKVDAKYFRAYFQRGVIYVNKKQFVKAERNFSQAIAINPKFWGAYVQRGVLYRHLQKYDKALADFNLVVKHDSKNFAGYLHRGVLFYEMEDTKKALEDFHTVITLNPRHKKTYHHLFLCYRRLGQKEKMQEYIKKWEEK